LWPVDQRLRYSTIGGHSQPVRNMSVQKQVKFGIGVGVIVASMGVLAWLGYGESKTYYHTIAELPTLQGAARSHRLRVGGTVEPGSIQRMPGRVNFVLQGEGKSLPVSYVGSDPLPDTFVDKSQALVEGSLAKDGSFVAEQVQAKCASKYEAAPGAGPGGSAAETGSSSAQSKTM
jgi:cytochrome c-type biogenesis protein CcmE